MSSTITSDALTAGPLRTTADPIRVEHGHVTRWIVGGISVALVAGAGVVGVRMASTSAESSPVGPAVARTDALESAHGHGATIRSGAGPAVAVASTVAAVPALVAHRTPPRGMAEDTASTSSTSTQRSESPRALRRDLPFGA